MENFINPLCWKEAAGKIGSKRNISKAITVFGLFTSKQRNEHNQTFISYLPLPELCSEQILDKQFRIYIL